MSASRKDIGTVDQSRRSFLVGSAATGLVMGFADPLQVLGAGEAYAAGRLAPTVWFDMGADGVCTLHVAKAEMGQHVGTALAQLVAEELEISWRDMRIDYPDADPKYNDPLLGALITG